MNETTQKSQTSPLIRLSSIVFFLSGCSALIFETVWFRIASTVLGTTVWSAAVVLMAFMMGLGVGNGLLALRGNRLSNPVLVYICLEIIIGVAGVLAVFALPALSDVSGVLLSGVLESSALLNVARFAIAFLVFVIPAIAMGATLPVLQKALHALEGSFSVSIARLYGWKTLGAVAGTLVAEFLLIYWLGLRATAITAALLNFGAALLLYQHFKGDYPVLDEKLENSRLGRVKSLLLAPALAGLLLLALEVIWFRYLLLVQNESSSLFAVMLAVVLVGIALGGLLISRVAYFQRNLNDSLVYLPLAAALVTVLSLLSFQGLYNNYLPLIRDSQALFALAAFVLMFPTSMISGMLFSLYGERLYRELGVNTQSSGMLTIANTFGAALGSALATFLLLPVLGIENSFLIIAICYLVIALYSLIPPMNTQRSKASMYSAALLLPVILLLFPYNSLERGYRTFSSYLPGMDLVDVDESIYATLQYYRSERLGETEAFTLVTNGYSMSGTGFSGERYMKLFAYLPAIFHGQIEDVLLISYGVGNTAESATNLSTLNSLDIVDVSEAIVEMSRPLHTEIGYGPLDDQRTNVYINDGRFYLKTTEKKYDLITGEPPPPKTPTIVNLYSKEFFELTREHLNPGGVISYWLPIHDLHDIDSVAFIRAFCDVYSDCSLWNGHNMDWILLGSRDGLPSMNDSEFAASWQRYANDELANIGFETPGLLGATFMADNTELKGLSETFLPETDNFPQRISSSTVGMRDPSPLYDYLLNIENRRRVFTESDYVAQQFAPSFREQTLASFELERINGLVEPNPHIIHPLPYYWDALSDLLEGEDMRTVPLLLMGSSPREQRILAGKGDASDIESRAARVKYHLVERDYRAALAEIAEFQPLAPDVESRLYFEQLRLMSLGLLGELGEEIVDTSPLRNDAGFRAWLVRRFL